MSQTKNTLLSKTVEIICILVLLSHWILVIFSYSVLPEIIPIHFNAAGKADGFGSKSTIFMTPILSLLLYILITAISKNPKNFNYPVKLTPENEEKQFNIATRLMLVIKLIIVSLFFIVDYTTIQIAKTNSKDGLGTWFLPVFLVVMFTPILFSVYQSIKNK